jgi:nucleolar pre-ribosomal-associated protein 1
LYERDTTEERDGDSIPADVAHHFLLAICTHPGVGVCFKDHGWYPRMDEREEWIQDAPEETSLRQQGRIFNKILANVLKTLRVNEDSRQQELALRILAACPELVAG